jgi:Fe-S cluster biosynthesis and repair protein YggX
MSSLTCSRCDKEGERQSFKPFRNDLGQRIYDSICQDCWAEWLQTQQQLINHYALVPHKPEARAFLMKNLEAFCFGEGAPDRIP